MAKIFGFEEEDVRRIAAAIRAYEGSEPIQQTQRSTARNKPSSELGIAITTEEIQPNTFGLARFAHGPKGEEVAYGPEYLMFFRNEEPDPQPCPASTKCYRSWVPCNSLEGEQTGWELTPIACIDA